MRRVVVGFSGGVSSAWCAGWALRSFPRDEVVLLFNDTKEEDPDTYRFIREMSAALAHPITERSDGRSVTEVFEDEGALANDRMAFCSRILKTEPRDAYFKSLQAEQRRHALDTGDWAPLEIVLVLGFSASEEKRVQRAAGRAERDGYAVRFPMIEEKVSKQATVDWCLSKGVRPSSQYEWSDHANCVGCARGGRAYWLAVKEHRPEVYEQRAALERKFGHTLINGISLDQLVKVGLKRPVARRESIEIGPCDCGD